jgi:hypothetical protein
VSDPVEAAMEERFATAERREVPGRIVSNGQKPAVVFAVRDTGELDLICI